MISIVIPCFNEQDVLAQLYSRLHAAAESWGEPFEIIAIDDGSDDSTWEILETFAQRDPRWKLVRLARNFGHQAAVSAGLTYSSGDAIITIDADLQDPPEILGLFIEKWRQGYDVVYGVRRQRKEGRLKRFLYHFFYRLLSALADTEIPKDSGDFSLIDRKSVV